MNNNKRPLQTREEKLKYLEGLKNRSRSLSEITDLFGMSLTYRDDQPGIVLYHKSGKNTGRYVSAEEAEVIKAKARANNIHIWEEHKTYLDSTANKPADEMNDI